MTGTVRSLDWMHLVRDSSDLVVAANAVKYRRDKFDEDVHYVSPSMVKLVAFAYGTFMNQEGVARVGVSTICKRFKLAAKTVRAAKLVIARAGWWRVEPGGGAGNTDVVIAQIPTSATYFKRGDSVTPWWAETGDGVTESGDSVPPKSFEEKTSLGRGNGPRDHLQGEDGPEDAERDDEEHAA